MFLDDVVALTKLVCFGKTAIFVLQIVPKSIILVSFWPFGRPPVQEYPTTPGLYREPIPIRRILAYLHHAICCASPG